MCGWKERYGGLPVPLEWANQLTPAGLDEAPNEPGEREGGRGPGRPGGVLRARARSVPGAPSLPGCPGPPDPMLGPQLACGAHSHPCRTWLFFFLYRAWRMAFRGDSSAQNVSPGVGTMLLNKTSWEAAGVTQRSQAWARVGVSACLEVWGMVSLRACSMGRTGRCLSLCELGWGGH